MAVRPINRLILILILIVAGIAAAFAVRSRFLQQRQADENRFISTYLAMSLSREKYIAQPDSFNIAIREIFGKFETDSTWMADYGRKLSKDLVKSEHVWARIAAKLDSLRKTPNPDSVLVTRRYQP